MEHKPPPPPCNNQKDEDISGGRGGEWVQCLNLLVVNIGPLNQTQTLMLGRTPLWRKERGQCPLRGLGLAQPPSQVEQLGSHLQLFPKLQPMSNLKEMFHKIDPHPWKMHQFMKAFNGLVLERCYETSLRTETGCSLPTT